MLKNSKVVLFPSPSKVGQAGNFLTLPRTTSYYTLFALLHFKYAVRWSGGRYHTSTGSRPSTYASICDSIHRESRTLVWFVEQRLPLNFPQFTESEGLLLCSRKLATWAKWIHCTYFKPTFLKIHFNIIITSSLVFQVMYTYLLKD